MNAWPGSPCRLCLCGDSLNTIPDNPHFLNAIFDASGVKVSPTDELPQNLCDECFSFINQSSIFRKKSQETNNTLLDMINKINKYLSIKKEILMKKLLIVSNDDFRETQDIHTIENINMQEDNNTENFHDESNTYEVENLGIKNEDLSSDNEDLTWDNNDTAKVKNKKAKCHICDKEMLSTSLKQHLNRHKLYGKVLKKGSKARNKKPLAECDTCGKRMPKKRLLAHFLIHDGSPGNLICKHCGKNFDRPSRLLRHCRAKHGYVKVDKCSHCDFMGCTEYEVRVHEKQHTSDHLLTCEICGKSFKWKNAWLQHMAEHGDANLLCSECPEIFQSTRQLARHKSQKHIPISNLMQEFQCPHCQHTALHKSTIQAHIKKKHEEHSIENLLVLPNDDFGETQDIHTIENINMQEDYNIENIQDESNTNEVEKSGVENKNLSLDHEGLKCDNKGTAKVKNKKAKCHICDKEMLSTSLKEHLNRHKLYGKVLKKGSKARNKKPLAECDTCGKRMPKNRLLAHFLIHDGLPGKLICKHCGKNFDRPFGLLRHCRAKHGYEKVDKCSHCDFMGCSEYEVRVHEKQHTSDHLLTCEICGKSFKWKNAWLQHMAEHGDANLLCSECPEIFRSTRQLARHKSQKHKPLTNIVRKFQCPHCPHAALYKRTIQIHMQIKHGANNKQDIYKVYKSLSSEDSIKLNTKNDEISSKNVNVNKKLLRTDIIKSKAIKITKREYKNGGEVNFLSAFHKHLDGDNVTGHVDNPDLSADNETGPVDNPDLSEDNVTGPVDIPDFSGDNVTGHVDNPDLSGDNVTGHVDNPDLSGDNVTGHVDNPDLSLSKIEMEKLSNTVEELQVDSETDTYFDSMGEVLNAESVSSQLQNNTETDSAYKKYLIINNKYDKVEVLKTNEDLQVGNVDLNMDKDLNGDFEVIDPARAKGESTLLKGHFDINTYQRKRITCEHCGKVYDRPSRLQRHYKASHGYEKTDHCRYCDFRGSTRFDVKLHERTHTGQEPYSCQHCGETFRHSTTRQQHLAVKHGETRIVQCEECALFFLTPRQLSSHKYDKHRPRQYSYQCALCLKVYKRRGAARSHLLRNHNQDKIFDKIIKLKLVN